MLILDSVKKPQYRKSKDKLFEKNTCEYAHSR